MLSIGKLGRGQERYYLDKVAEAAEDYYSGEAEAEGYWLGGAANDLDLAGKVDPRQLTAMLTGDNPATGEPLGLRHVSGRGPVPGFDLTFSAPKSVSIMWALGGHPLAAEVKAAHAASVDAALSYLQRNACWTRRGKGGREFLQGNGFLAAGYVHRSSRAGDMQIHTHVLVANATFAEGRWIEAAVTAHASHFDRRDVIQAVADCLPAGAPGREVERLADAFLASPEVVHIAPAAKGDRYTTRAIWQLERTALDRVEVMAARSDCATVPEVAVSRVLAQRPSMKPDQRAMVERLLGSGEGVVVVVGEAGTGKTYALTAAAGGWASAGRELRAAAPTWRAANVLRSEGLPATSLARLLYEFDRAAARGEAPLARGSVLVVDEAGMVDSRSLARLILRAQEAEAKLVLIGDPEQLGEIEAGGLFAAITARTEPIALDEVIRHRHDLEREGAKLIRSGSGREALSIYEGAERVTVSDDPVARREAMVADWWRSFERGEDALMIAKRNAEVAELNALARERMKAAGRLGEAEIEVGGARFAVGDQIITRINDQRARIYNRERWRVTEVDGKSGQLVLAGIDTRGRVCVDSGYLEGVRERDGRPAIEHAYAATTYQAQGATVDTAFVMADPSMDRQEFYVATSRTREQTYLYATPEVQLQREEIAPRSPYLRDGLEHIAEATERDGSQAAAHDAALRSEFADLPTDELARRVRELRAEAGAERHNEAAHQRAAEAAREDAERLGLLEARGNPQSEARAWAARERIEQLRAEREQLPEVRHEARARAAVAEHVLAERERAAAAAARISPPDYLTRELGERPADPNKRAAWDRGAREIEGYRLRNGVVDRDTALGPKPRSHAAQVEQRRARERLERARRELQLHRRAASDVARDRGIGR